MSPGTARKQKKKDRERIRYAAMSNEKRLQRNTRDREAWNCRKGEGT